MVLQPKYTRYDCETKLLLRALRTMEPSELEGVAGSAEVVQKARQF